MDNGLYGPVSHRISYIFISIIFIVVFAAARLGLSDSSEVGPVARRLYGMCIESVVSGNVFDATPFYVLEPSSHVWHPKPSMGPKEGDFLYESNLFGYILIILT